MFFFYCCIIIFFFKQKTAYEMRISDWSSDVCSSDLLDLRERVGQRLLLPHDERDAGAGLGEDVDQQAIGLDQDPHESLVVLGGDRGGVAYELLAGAVALAPAVHGGDHVLRGHRRAVVAHQAVEPLEGKGKEVVTELPPTPHLRRGV